MFQGMSQPQIGAKRDLRCIVRDFGTVASQTDSPNIYEAPPPGEWWGPHHPDFGTASQNTLSTGNVESILGTDRKPVYVAGKYTSKANFDWWYKTDTRPLDEASETPVNLEIQYNVPLTYGTSGWFYDSASENPPGFWILDNKGFQAGSSSSYHNFHFTMECHFRFLFKGGEIFDFIGDDDVWVFINNKLVVDIGGLHVPVAGNVKLDTLEDLVVGKSYDMSLFYAERHATGSNFKMTTSLEAPPLRKLCLRASTTHPIDTFQSMKAMTQFPSNHAYMTRTTCGGNVYGNNIIPSTGPSFSPGCHLVSSGELLYGLNTDVGGSVSPIAKQKEVMIVSVIDGVGDVYIVLQGGNMPVGTNNYFVMDVGIDVGTKSGANTKSTMTQLHSPGTGGSTVAADWDDSKVAGEFQRLALTWTGTQTAGLVLGPFRGVGTCIHMKVVESGKVDKFAVGTMENNILKELPILPLAMEEGGLIICSYDCADPCTHFDHNSCEFCVADDTCGWSLGRGCFGLDSGISGVAMSERTCPEKKEKPTNGGGGDRGGSSRSGGGGGGGGSSASSPSAIAMDRDGINVGNKADDGGAVVVVFLLLLFCCCIAAAGLWYKKNKPNKHETLSTTATTTTKTSKKKQKQKQKPMQKHIEMTGESSSSSLPPGWTQFIDESSGYLCYSNITTGEISWDCPNPTSKSISNPMNRLSHGRSETVLPPGWTKDHDVNGAKYYFHHSSGDVQWEKPAGSVGGGKCPALPAGWTASLDEASGYECFYNFLTGESTWERPS